MLDFYNNFNERLRSRMVLSRMVIIRMSRNVNNETRSPVPGYCKQNVNKSNAGDCMQNVNNRYQNQIFVKSSGVDSKIFKREKHLGCIFIRFLPFLTLSLLPSGVVPFPCILLNTILCETHFTLRDKLCIAVSTHKLPVVPSMHLSYGYTMCLHLYGFLTHLVSLLATMVLSQPPLMWDLIRLKIHLQSCANCKYDGYRVKCFCHRGIFFIAKQVY